ncbi:ribonuclease R [Pseudoroseicyclus sp. H15]
MAKLPTKQEILAFLSEHPEKTHKRDIAKAFGIKGAERIDLKRMLKELEIEGHVEKKRRSYRDPETLPPVSILQVSAPDADGDLTARPLEWHGEGEEPTIRILPREGDPALGQGDRILARLTPTPGEEQDYTARMIRRIAGAPQSILGIYRKGAEGGRIMPIDKKADRQWIVSPGHEHGAKDGELVEAEQAGPKGRMGLPKARITQRLGAPGAPRAVSLIAIHQHGIPHEFPSEVLAEADAAKPAGLKGRENLQHLPLVTIDPADARDRDDAVLARADEAADNPGGHVLWVAIADVAHYVRPGSELDREAFKRGNSTYFPDRVVPMLPDRLSGDLCSLHEGVPRAVLAVQIRIREDGSKLDHRFHRGLTKSRASFPYEEVQAAMDGAPSARAAALMDEVIRPLYAAYDALLLARGRRQPLELDLPERQIVLNEAGEVTSVDFKERLTAHKLIEEFMVLANVCAAETLKEKKTPLLYRVHEEPDPQKLESLREVAEGAGLTLAKGQVLQTKHLNQLLAQAEGKDEAELINMSTLRAMSQAYYGPDNFGHFGLALRNYAHFTSPIRRYSDLIVHRALVSAHRWGDDGLSQSEIDRMGQIGEQISDTERRSMMAERDTVDRYLAAYMSERVGSEMPGRVAGVAKFGLFVKLDDAGADVLIPIRTLGGEFFHYDRESQSLMGSQTGRVMKLGQRAVVKLSEAAAETGGLVGELVSIDDAVVPRGPSQRPGKPPRRKQGAARKKAAAKERKVSRVRRR